METTYTNLKKVKEKHGEIEYEAEIPLEVIAQHETKELEHMGRNVAIPGFRKGKVPEPMLRERIDPAELLETALESALRKAVAEIIVNEKLDILGTPELTLKEVTAGKATEFSVRIALAPAVTLPDYAKIGREILTRKDEVTISDKELEDALAHIRKMAAHTLGEHLHAHDKKEGEDTNPEKLEENIPELTDEVAQKMGNFKDVAALKEEIKRELLAEKMQRGHNTRRDEVVKEIAKHTKLEIPELLIEQEWRRYVEDRDDALVRAGTTLEAYLKDLKKTGKDLEKEERKNIEDQIRTSLVFKQIKKEENIEATEREINTNLAILRRRYPDRDPRELHRAAEAFLIQEKIFKLFEPKEEIKKEEPEKKEEDKEQTTAPIPTATT